MNVSSLSSGAARLALLLLVLAIVCTELGRWQLRRADERRASAERYETALASDVLQLVDTGADPRALRYRRLALEGSYLASVQILLDNRTRNGRAGYEVLTPFDVGEGRGLILVNRGWIVAGPDRARLPEVSVSRAPRHIVGQIDEFPVPGLRLANAELSAPLAGPVVMSFPSLAELGAAVGRPIAPYQLLLAADQADGYLRDWRPDERGVATNLAYAGQWFLFAAMALVAAAVIWLRGRRRRGPPVPES